MGGGGDIEETEAERAQAQVALQRWNDYKGSYAKFEDSFMDQVDNLNSDQSYQRATELAITPLARQFAEQGANMNRQMQAQGVNPNSGKSYMANGALNTMQASAEVDASSRATSSQQDNYVTGIQNINAIGQGQAGTAMQGLSSIANTSKAYAQSQAQDAGQRATNINSGIGLALGGATSYGLNKLSNNENGG